MVAKPTHKPSGHRHGLVPEVPLEALMAEMIDGVTEEVVFSSNGSVRTTHGGLEAELRDMLNILTHRPAPRRETPFTVVGSVALATRRASSSARAFSASPRPADLSSSAARYATAEAAALDAGGETDMRSWRAPDALRKRVEKFGLADRFVIQPTEDLHKTFGDPAPGCAKVLRVRYVIRGVRGEVYALEERPGHLSAPFLVAAPHGDTLLFVKHATYGHPRGMIKGRGAFNITELVQVRQRQARATARGDRARDRARPRFLAP